MQKERNKDEERETSPLKKKSMGLGHLVPFLPPWQAWKLKWLAEL